MVNSLHFYNVSHILHPVPFAFPGIPFPMVLTTMVITLTFDPRVILLLLKTWLAKYLAIQKLVDEKSNRALTYRKSRGVHVSNR